MENEYLEQPEENQDEAVEIYSRRAIRGFAIFFSPLFGGILLMINLRNVGYKKAANLVLAGSLAYTFLMGIAINYVLPANGMSTIVFSVIGGILLADYVFPKYFPEEDYYPKPIWTPLLIGIGMCVLFFTLMYQSGQMPR